MGGSARSGEKHSHPGAGPTCGGTRGRGGGSERLAAARLQERGDRNSHLGAEPTGGLAEGPAAAKLQKKGKTDIRDVTEEV